MAQHQKKKRSAHFSPSDYGHSSPCPCRSDGRDNLAPGQTYGTWDQEVLLPKRQGSRNGKAVIFVALLAFVFGFFLNERIDVYRHEALRRQWAESEGRWKSDLAFIHEERLKWDKERKEYSNEKAKERLEWTREREEYANEKTEGRLRWAKEHEEHENEKTAERMKWAEERKNHANEEAKKERQKREKETSQRNRMTWSGLDASQQCLRYGTREYTATLTDVPLGFDAIAECRNKPIVIHGKRWLPGRCEDQGICGRVTGHWIVDSNEALCTTWWDNFSDKGCKNGVRVYDAHLQNLQGGDDWKVMCSTTPTTINGKYFAEPVSCVNWGRNGIGGIWHLPDYKCR